MCNEMSMCKKKKRDLEDLGHTKFGKFRKGISVQFFTLHVQRNEHVQKKKRDLGDLGHTKFGKFRKGISVQFVTLHVQGNEHVQHRVTMWHPIA